MEKNLKYIVLIILILIFIVIKQQYSLNYEKKLSQQNEAALKRELNVTVQKNGDILKDRAIYFSSMEDLKKENREMYDYFKELKKSGFKSELVTITNFVYTDSGSVKNDVTNLGNNKFSLDFSYNDSDSVISINGKSKFFASYANDKISIKPDSTIFDSIKFQSGIMLSIAKDKKGIERIIAKPSPYTNKIRITNIDAVGIEKYYKDKYKVKKFSIGPQIGYGVSLVDGRFRTVPYVGIGISYKIINF